MRRRERTEMAKATGSIRYTSDSNGQGVREGQPVSNELDSWVGAGRDQHFSQHSTRRSANRWALVARMVTFRHRMARYGSLANRGHTILRVASLSPDGLPESSNFGPVLNRHSGRTADVTSQPTARRLRALLSETSRPK